MNRKQKGNRMSSNLTYTTKEIANATFFALLEQELSEQGSVRFRVKGFSMEPMLRNNRDEVQLVTYQGEELTQKDICLFKFRGRHILHRFLRYEGDLLFFQGDNVLVNYEYCRSEDVIGMVKVIYRDGKMLSPFSEKWQRRIKLHRFKQQIRRSVSSCIPAFIKQFIKKNIG